jgi:hypothetical protein
MAVPNRGQLVAAAWEDYVKTDPADQIFNYFWLLKNLQAGQSFRKGNGDPITGTIAYTTNTTVKAMSELETLDVTRVDIFDRYEYAWKFIGGNIVMSEFEKQVTSGGAGKFDLEAGKIDNLKNTMQQTINTDLYSDGTGSAGKQAGGLQYLVSSTPTTGTVGTVNRATYTFWRNQQTSGAKSSTIYDNLKGSMRSIYNLCSSGVGMTTPEFAVTDRTTFEGYESLSVSLERLERSSASDTLLSGYKGDHIMFKDIPLAFDFAAPNALVYILNRKNLFIRYMLWMKAFPPNTPVNQFIDVVKIFTIYNLCVGDNPRRVGLPFLRRLA